MPIYFYEITMKHNQKKLRILFWQRPKASEYYNVKFISSHSDFDIAGIKNAKLTANKACELDDVITEAKRIRV